MAQDTSDGAATPTRRPPTDWEAVERDYRTGLFTLRELGDKHGAAFATIGQRAKREGWLKDLREAVRQATNARLITQAVAHTAATATHDVAQTVRAAAEVNLQVIMRHRAELDRARVVAMALLDELASDLLTRADRDQLARLLAQGATTEAQAADAQRVVARALALSTRVGSVKSLAEAITRLHAGERMAFGMEGDGRGKRGEDAAAKPVTLWTDAELVADIMTRRAAEKRAEQQG
jgi:hypothetical protein